MWSQLPDWLRSQDYVAYAFSGLLVATYAWTRFNTPAPTRYATPEMAKASQLIDRFNASTSIRCSTRQALYRWSCCGYTLAALMLFICLSMVLKAGPWRDFLLGPKDNPSLPAPLIATLAMTTLMSSIPVLQRLDAWLLACFHNWAGIPAEVRRRAAAISTEHLTITEFDVAELRERYGDDSYGDTLARHLRASRG